MAQERRPDLAAALVVTVAMVGCTALSGLNDLTVCGSAECSTGPGADGGGTTDGPIVNEAGASSLTLFALGGSVSKLTGKGLVLKNGVVDQLAIDHDGPFSLPMKLAGGTAYAVTVGSQPSAPSQICTVANGSGVMSGADVTNIDVSCSTTAYSVGGVMIGTAAGVVLTNNGGDDLTLAPNAPFKFPTKVPSGMPFGVAIKARERGGDSCNVSGATGVVGVDDVATVVVNCEAGTYTVGGTIAGLTGTLVAQSNGGNDTKITANGTFAFSTTFAAGTNYAVTVLTQPTYPPMSQTCNVANGTGTTTAANVTDVAITCTTNAFPVGGTVKNLRGPSFVLRNNAADDLTITANGPFHFSTSVPSGGTYDVTVATPPPGEKCTIQRGKDIVANGEITDVDIECGQDPGIKCAPDLYCATGTYCCFDRNVGRGTCIATGGGCGAVQISCDSFADCGGDAVCCARFNKNNGQFRDVVCQPSAAACAQSAGNILTELWCDVLAAAPCPAGMTCAGAATVSGYAKCQ